MIKREVTDFAIRRLGFQDLLIRKIFSKAPIVLNLTHLIVCRHISRYIVQIYIRVQSPQEIDFQRLNRLQW